MLPISIEPIGRRLTTDYRKIVVQAVDLLETNSKDARASVYDRARTLLRQRLTPSLTEPELDAELAALEQAIAKVEADALKKLPPAKPFQMFATPQVEPQTPPKAQPAGQPRQPPQASPQQPPKAPPQPPLKAPSQQFQPPPFPQRSPQQQQQPAEPARYRLPLFHRITLMVLGLAFVVLALLVLGPLATPNMALGDKIGIIVTWTILATMVVMAVFAVLYRRKRCREAGLIKHRVHAFAWGKSPERRRVLAKQLDDRSLLWCHFLPEHAQPAKAIVREELERRGHGPQDIEAWTPAPAEVTVPPAVETPFSPRRLQFPDQGPYGLFQHLPVRGAALGHWPADAPHHRHRPAQKPQRQRLQGVHGHSDEFRPSSWSASRRSCSAIARCASCCCGRSARSA